MPFRIEKAPKWAPDGNHQGLSLSVSEAPSPRKLRNDSPGIMPSASRLMCATLSFHVLCAHRALPVPFSWPLQISEIPAKSGGLDILVQNSFITTKINTRRPHVLTHFPSPLLLWHDMAPNVSLSHHVLTRVYRLYVCVTWITLTCIRASFFLHCRPLDCAVPQVGLRHALKGCNNAAVGLFLHNGFRLAGLVH